jgi:hypothetical protein
MVPSKDAVTRLVEDFLRDILRSLHSLFTHQMLIPYVMNQTKIELSWLPELPCARGPRWRNPERLGNQALAIGSGKDFHAVKHLVAGIRVFRRSG